MKKINITEQEVFIKKMQGKASKEEELFVDKLLSESEANKKEFESLKLLWKKTEVYDLPSTPDAEQMWDKISGRINRPVADEPIGYDYSWIIKAAAVLLLAVSGIFFYTHIKETSEPRPDNYSVSKKEPETNVNYHLTTRNGERTICVLPDSSVVHLNSESRLIYPKYFEGEKRVVELTGEAYFSVKPNKSRPFIVKSGNSEVTVTGTEFNIRSRNNRTKVVVAKGSVNVLSLSSMREERLKKGEMVQLDNSGNLSAPEHVNLKYYLAWRENKLAFMHTSLSEVMGEIERTFNVRVEFLNNSAKYRSLTGIFDTDSLEKILSVLSLTLDLNISQKGMRIIIQ